MVNVLEGNIFDSKAQTLVNTVNCVGVMGKGLALEFKKRFPDMFADYEQRCKRHEVKLGEPYLFRSLLPPLIVLFPTKQDWRSVSNILSIEQGLKHLKRHYKEWGIESIAVPPLGCGLGELDWNVVGPTLFRHLSEFDIPVDLYAPYGTPQLQLTPQFLGQPAGESKQFQTSSRKLKVEPGLVAAVEVLRRIEEHPFHWPIGRTLFLKIAYFVTTRLNLDTGLKYRRASFGPFSDNLKHQLTKLVNNGLIEERNRGRMFELSVGRTFEDAWNNYAPMLGDRDNDIERLVDLFLRMDTKRAELASTVDFALLTMKKKDDETPSEEELLNEVMAWKKRHRPPYDENEVAETIRNLAMLGWLNVKPSEKISEVVGTEV